MNIFAFFSVLLLAASLSLGVTLHQATKAKDDALADKARLSVVADAQREVIDAMHADVAARDQALAERDKTINSLNAAAFAAVETIGRAVNEPAQCDLDAPLPVSLSAPLLLLHRQAAGGDSAASGQGDGAAVAVSAPPLPRTAVADDGAGTRAMGGKAAGLGR